MKEKDSIRYPKVSIVIPIFNREQFIQNLVSCIKKQIFEDFECIMVDDGSTDQTGDLCDSLTAGDERFIVLHTSNFGVSHARNTALDVARGQYVTFVDSDDNFPIDYLQKMVNRMETQQVDMVIGSFRRIYANGESIKIEYPFKERIYMIDELMEDFACIQKESGVFGRCWAKLFSREIVSGIRFDETLKLAEDFDFYLKLYPRIKTVFFDNTCEYGYYAGAENSSEHVADDDIDYISQLKIYIRYKAFLENAGFFCGNNEQIVTEKIQNYLYFSILHSRPETIHQLFRKAQMLSRVSNVKYVRRRGLKGIVLYCIYMNNEKAVVIIMAVYRALRKILRVIDVR